MDSLSGLFAFVRTAECGSFVAAGRMLGVSASAVGKGVMRLEAKLGVRLLHRSTRQLRLTDEGALFFERCRRILDDIGNAELELARLTEAPRGRVRVSLPAVGYHLLLPVLPEFARRYPEVELDLDFNDRLVDVIDEGFDLVIRSGELADSRLMSRRLRPFELLLCAAPAYLAARGMPRQPSELERHACLRFRFPATGRLQPWFAAEEAGGIEPRLPATMTLNNIEAVLRAAIAGLGLACLPDFIADEALRDGRLVQALPGHRPVQGMFWMLWPTNRHMLPKLRVLVDFLSASVGREP
jgi:DNA-binding transcriptional LysR family regulator